MSASVIICTRNRAASLDQTLAALQSLNIPADLSCELLIVDNGSTDNTADIVRKYSTAKMPPRYLFESTPGLAGARNVGVASARGEAILFTDDDVRPSKNWLELMVRPLLARECDAAVGRILLADDLQRAWMTEKFRAFVAWNDGALPLELVGANMGLHRSVFDRIPAFDQELGAGALGFHEDGLFGWQLTEAGFRLRYIAEASVVHHAEQSRLLRGVCLNDSKKMGASTGYVLHHWKHEELAVPRLRYYYLALKLMLRRLVQPPPALDAETALPWEASYVAGMAKCRQFLVERHRPRNYSKRGLVKQANRSPAV